MMSPKSGPRKTHKHKGNGVRRFTGGSRPQGHLPRLISDLFGLVFFDDPGSEEYSFMCHSFMCLFGVLILSSGRAPEWSPTPPRQKIKLRAGPGGPGDAPGGRFGAPRAPQDPQNPEIPYATVSVAGTGPGSSNLRSDISSACPLRCLRIDPPGFPYRGA